MYIGRALPRQEDNRFLTGRGEYTEDLKFADCAHAAVVRSPHAHALICSIELADAESAPGVLCVLDGERWNAHQIGNDLLLEAEVGFPDGRPMNKVPRPVLPEDKVCYVGMPVAVVVAETREQAQQAAELVFVDYEDLPAVTDLDAARAENATLIHEQLGSNEVLEIRAGDRRAVEAALSASHHVTELEVRTNRITGAPMELRSCVGEYDRRRERYTLWSNGQLLNTMRRWISTTLRCRPDQVRIVLPDMGGGFGTRAYYYPEQPMVLLASKLCDRPVRYTATRSEVMQSDHQARDYLARGRMGFDVDGRITAMSGEAVNGFGAYPSNFNAMIAGHLFVPRITNIYDIHLAYGTMTGVYVNKAPVDAYRGVGESAITVCERLRDQGARELGLDPLEVRARNYIKAESYPYPSALGGAHDSGNPQGQHDLLLDISDYASLCKQRDLERAEGRLVGLGVTAYTDHAGLGPSRVEKGADSTRGTATWESGRVEVLDNGHAIISVGTHSHGQGHDTTFRQIAADTLGIPIERITYQQGDSDRVSSNFGTGAQRSVTSAGMAVHVAGKRIISKATRLAAHLMEVSEYDVVYEQGEFKIGGSDRSISFEEVVRLAYRGADYPEEDFELGLDITVRYDPGEDNCPTGVHLAMIEVDAETGVIELRGYWSVNDCGVRINPLVVDGQLHGGIAQGIGQVMFEELRYDDDGQLLPGSILDYNVPKADQLPHLVLGAQETPSPTNALGAKGVGECGVCGPPGAISNALADALRGFDLSAIEPPYTSEKVWEVLRQR